MNYQYLRIFRTLLLALIALGVIRCCQLRAAVVGAIASTNDLINYINPNSANTNYFLMSDTGTIADGTAAIWTYDAASSTDDADHIKPLLFGGRWVRNFRGIAGTNVFNTLYVTNLTVISNYITTNIFVVIGGDTNRVGLWTDFTTFIAPTSYTNSMLIDATGWRVLGPSGSTAQSYLDAENSGFRATAGGIASISVNAMPTAAPSSDTLYAIQAIDDNGASLVNMLPLLKDISVDPSVYTLGSQQPLASKLLLRIQNDGTNQITFGPLAQMNFGEGTTNVLYRSGSDLVYTNGGTEVNLVVKQGSGNYGKFQMTTGGHLMMLGGPSSDLFFGPNNNGSGDYTMTGTALSPTLTGVKDLGGATAAWKDFYLTNHIVFGPGTTNVLYRSGTDYYMTNGTLSNFGLHIAGPAGDSLLEVNGTSGEAILAASALNAPVYIHSGGNAPGLVVGSSSIQPNIESMSIGANTSNGAWTNSFVKGITRVIGQNNGAGDYAWCAIYVSNGICCFDYQNLGSGIAPTKFSFMTNGVEVGSFP